MQLEPQETNVPTAQDAALEEEIASQLETIENDAAAWEENNLTARADAIDHIEFHILDRIAAASDNVPSKNLAILKHRAESLQDRLEEVNTRYFQQLRDQIRSGDLTGADVKCLLDQYAESKDSGQRGYDLLDVFVGGLLRLDEAPRETRTREPEMVFYQPTPVRIILELVEQVHLGPNTVFYDLGSGLGQVCILVHLLTGAKTKGVEFEPAYYDYARRCVDELNLSSVEFINQDVRDIDYSDGMTFFMYTPFKGKLLQTVLEKLKHETETRSIRICTYGECTFDVAKQAWLHHIGQEPMAESALAIFEKSQD